MKKSLFTLLLLLTTLGANSPLKEHKKPPLSFSLPLLQTIEKHSIVLGHGPIHAHVFIDPKCPMSRDFVSMISESSRMQDLYTYHFYIFELKRFHSKELIRSIYESKDPKSSMLQVMREKKNISNTNKTIKVKQFIEKIEKVAKKIGVYKRPYLILVKKGKK